MPIAAHRAIAERKTGSPSDRRGFFRHPPHAQAGAVRPSTAAKQLRALIPPKATVWGVKVAPPLDPPVINTDPRRLPVYCSVCDEDEPRTVGAVIQGHLSISLGRDRPTYAMTGGPMSRGDESPLERAVALGMHRLGCASWQLGAR